MLEFISTLGAGDFRFTCELVESVASNHSERIVTVNRIGSPHIAASREFANTSKTVNVGCFFIDSELNTLLQQIAKFTARTSDPVGVLLIEGSLFPQNMFLVEVSISPKDKTLTPVTLSFADFSI